MKAGIYLTMFCATLFPLLIAQFSCALKPHEKNTNHAMIPDTTWQKLAGAMVDKQIIARGVTNKNVIHVMKSTPRHLFVPVNIATHAYDDSPLPIAARQTISQPYIVALMTELLQPGRTEKVLEIGTGSGYQAAVLSPLVDTVYTIELLKPLADTALRTFQKLGYRNIIAKQGDGYQGWPEHAPFDKIIITAAPEEIPPKLIEQLKTGGRMVVPVGRLNQELLVITKTQKGIKRESVIPVRFVPMVKPK